MPCDTPPGVTVLGYRQGAGGESGREAERHLLGGNLELYHDVDDNHGEVSLDHLLSYRATMAYQTGIPHLLINNQATAAEIRLEAIQAFVSNVRCKCSWGSTVDDPQTNFV